MWNPEFVAEQEKRAKSRAQAALFRFFLVDRAQWKFISRHYFVIPESLQKRHAWMQLQRFVACTFFSYSAVAAVHQIDFVFSIASNKKKTTRNNKNYCSFFTFRRRVSMCVLYIIICIMHVVVDSMLFRHWTDLLAARWYDSLYQIFVVRFLVSENLWTAQIWNMFSCFFIFFIFLPSELWEATGFVAYFLRNVFISCSYRFFSLFAFGFISLFFLFVLHARAAFAYSTFFLFWDGFARWLLLFMFLFRVYKFAARQTKPNETHTVQHMSPKNYVMHLSLNRKRKNRWKTVFVCALYGGSGSILSLT